MRVITLASSDYAGSLPILSRPPVARTSAAMADDQKIDVVALKKAVIDSTGPGKPFTRRALSLAASNGKNPDLVRDLISRGQDKKISFDTALGIAQALKINISQFVVNNPSLQAEHVITVIGSVEAGVWRQQEQWDKDRQYTVEVMPIPYGSTKRFGLEVIGYSMDKVFLPGTILDCIDVWNSDGIKPIPGDIVIVVRHMGDLFETTCKRLEQLPDGEYQLRAESTRPEFAEPIRLGKPSDGHFGDDEIRIIGIVNSAITRIMRR